MRADGSVPSKKKEFSYEGFGEQVADAISSLDGISDAKWAEILACSTSVQAERSVQASPSTTHVERRQMFNFESPVKRRT